MSAQNTQNPNPQAPAAPEQQVKCNGCNGRGIYYGHGYVENGVFKGFTGPCYRCNGKGYQTKADQKRNWGYDNYHRRFYP